MVKTFTIKGTNMKIAIGCDHAGIALKQTVIDKVKENGHTPVDMGTHDTSSVDFPDYATLVCKEITEKRADLGILLCGSGIGMSIAANKFKGIRAGLCHNTYSAAQGVEHNNMNVLCMGARIIGPSVAQNVVDAFLKASFSKEERHARRVAKIFKIETENL
jgi:ribose 5-phosphate isomerase B